MIDRVGQMWRWCNGDLFLVTESKLRRDGRTRHKFVGLIGDLEGDHDFVHEANHDPLEDLKVALRIA